MIHWSKKRFILPENCLFYEYWYSTSKEYESYKSSDHLQLRNVYVLKCIVFIISERYFRVDLSLKNVWINCNPCLQINNTEVQVTQFVKRGLGGALNR